MKDWIGNKKSTFVTLGASSHTDKERQREDYYATDPKAVYKLLEVESFNKNIWECAVGEGHIAKVLIENGYTIRASDIVDRGFENTEIIDFLNKGGLFDSIEKWKGDIITNPPYKYAKEFVERALEVINDGNRVAMILKIQFLESEKRYELFKSNPPRYIYVFRKRVSCAMNGDFESYPSSAVCYCWYIWEKGFKGDPKVRWL